MSQCRPHVRLGHRLGSWTGSCHLAMRESDASLLRDGEDLYCLTIIS
jgi:hypothetical protein